MIRSKNRKQVDLGNKKTRAVFITLGGLFIALGIIFIVLGIRDMSGEDYFGFSPLMIVGIYFSFFGLFFLLMTIMAFVMSSLAKKKTGNQSSMNYFKDDSLGEKEKDGVECNYCHHINEPGSIYCCHCGEKIKTKVICPNCKTENDGSSSYCYHCGHRL